jgi:hypothetical protein
MRVYLVLTTDVTLITKDFKVKLITIAGITHLHLNLVKLCIELYNVPNLFIYNS